MKTYTSRKNALIAIKALHRSGAANVELTPRMIRSGDQAGFYFIQSATK